MSKLARTHCDDVYLALKSATRRLVKMAGGAESAQHITRVKASALSRFGSTSDEQFIPVDVVADLEADCGSAVVTAALAEILGLSLVAVTDQCANAKTLSAADITAMMKRDADLAHEIIDALADGEMSGTEAESIVGQAERAIGALRSIQKSARAMAKGERS